MPLITGDQVMVGPKGGGVPSYVLQPAPGGGAAEFYQGPAGDQFVVPVIALPYVGRELGRSLFDVSALARDGITGAARIPVRLAFAPGITPAAPPGVTLTWARGELARGYLTAASGRAFAAALWHQAPADAARGQLAGRGTLFGGMTAMDLAAPGAPALSRLGSPRHTVRFTLTDLAGRPANNVHLVVQNNGNLGGGPQAVPVIDGTGQVSVPAGDYSAYADFVDPGKRIKIRSFHEVTLNDFTVRASGVTKIKIDERSATSAIAVQTPRPATEDLLGFTLYRLSASGQASAHGLLEWDGPSVPVYVNAQPPAKVGRLRYLLQWGGAAPRTSGSYRYDVAFPANDIPANEHFVVSRRQLATVREHFFADPAATSKTGGLLNVPGDAVMRYSLFSEFMAGLGGETMPGNLTDYLGTADGGRWAQSVSFPRDGHPLDIPFGADLVADLHTFVSGRRYSLEWGHGPLVAGFGQHTSHGPLTAGFGSTHRTLRWNCQACAAGATLSLAFSLIGDSEPDHVNSPFLFGTPPPSHLTLYRGGSKLFSGAGAFGAVVHDARPGSYRVVLDVNRASLAGVSQSTYTHTDLTVRYAPNGGTPLPPGDHCAGQSAGTPCQVLPALTLSYQLAVNESNTSGSARQVLHLNVGHVSYDGAGSRAPITSAEVAVSFDGGKSWHTATVTGSRGRYTAVWPNPAPARGSSPEIRVTARDDIGGLITQIISHAYTIARADLPHQQG